MLLDYEFVIHFQFDEIPIPKMVSFLEGGSHRLFSGVYE
ncbi:unnamed protein product [Acidithrix sp. C25]|nr:unnamed protein product [Acidithrix sp. C25]